MIRPRDGRQPVDRRSMSPSRPRLAAVPSASPVPKSQKAVSPATDEQKAKVADLACLAIGDGRCWGQVDPAHLVDRSIAPSAGDDVRAVVPLCRGHHNQYDDHELDLSPFLEPQWRTEIAWAVEAVGLFAAMWRITGKRWQPGAEAYGG